MDGIIIGCGLGIGVGLFLLFMPRRHSSELPSKESREKHQAEYQDALNEIVRLDARLEELETERNRLKVQVAEYAEDIDELNRSVDHLRERLKTSEDIRQKLATSLSGRCCGNQITMGNTEAKIVHGSVVVSDPDAIVDECCEACRVKAGRWRTSMILCPICGNKRCPKAEDHRFQCSHSNELGQTGILEDTTEA